MYIDVYPVITKNKFMTRKALERALNAKISFPPTTASIISLPESFYAMSPKTVPMQSSSNNVS